MDCNDKSGAILAVSSRDDRRSFRVLMILAFFTSLMNYLDRSVLNIIAEPVKSELGFSDTQFGLLSGFAFALFYAVMGIPIARYSDNPKTDRPRLIAACVALWSVMTMACGMATSFVQLLGARGLVAIGESGSGPSIMNLIGHYVPEAKRSRTFAIYSLGVPTGILLGLMVGGLLVERVGWRATFMLLGAPGLLLALLIWLFLPEPRRSALESPHAIAPSPPFIENILFIKHSSVVQILIAAIALATLVNIGTLSWTGIYLIRDFGLSPTFAGFLLGLAMGVGGGLGTYFGGTIADMLSRRHIGRALLVPCFGLLVGTPAAVTAFLSHDWWVFVIFYWISVIGGAVYLGPFFSILQILVDIRLRATVIAIVMLTANLVGGGIGPLLVGLGSDLLHPHLGGNSLRWSLVGLQLIAFVPALLYIKASTMVTHALVDVPFPDRPSRSF